MSTPTPPKPPISNTLRRQTPPRVLTTIRSMHLRRNAPPPIPIPINPIRQNLELARPKRQPGTMPMRNDVKGTQRPPKLSTLPETPNQQTIKVTLSPASIADPPSTPKPESKSEKVDVVAVELSGYSPSLTRHDICELFSSFAISPDFQMPSTTKFAYPLRTLVWINGQEEANRAVRELDGTMIGGRRVRIALLDGEKLEEKENVQGMEMGEEDGERRDREKGAGVVEEEMVDEMKIAIIHAAHSHHLHLTHKILDVREYCDGLTHYAFLQAREHSAVPSAIEATLAQLESTARWELVAGGCADGRGAQGKERSGRLAALKKLQETVEEQGMLNKVWSQWNEAL